MVPGRQGPGAAGREGGVGEPGDCGHPSRAHHPLPLPPGKHPCPARWTCRDDGQRGCTCVNAVGRDVVLRIPTTDLPAEHRAGIPYGTERSTLPSAPTSSTSLTLRPRRT